MQPAGGTASDRYEKGIAKRTAAGSVLEEAKDKANAQNDIEDEHRSIHTELDYTKKDASRHIVQGKSNPAALR